MSDESVREPIQAHSKTQYKRLVARLRYIAETDDARFGGIRETLTDAISLLKRLVTQGANVLPPSGGAGANKGDGMEIKLTPAVIACLKRGLNCWAKQNDAEGIEIKEILKLAEKIAEDV
jgi:hypothetical protein